jgi:hypothetical protein
MSGEDGEILCSFLSKRLTRFNIDNDLKGAQDPVPLVLSFHGHYAMATTEYANLWSGQRKVFGPTTIPSYRVNAELLVFHDYYEMISLCFVISALGAYSPEVCAPLC